MVPIKPRYSGGFYSRKSVAEAFRIKPLPKDVHILVAHLEEMGWEESAYVLFERDGKLYEVFASHCSCYGFEDQWEPEETTIAALHKEIDDGWTQSHYCLPSLRSVLAKLEANHGTG